MNKNLDKGRKRIYRFELKMNEIENSKLNYDSLTAGISKSELLRNLIIQNEVKQKPDEKFYNVMDNMERIYKRLDELVNIAKETNCIDSNELEKEKKELKKFSNDIKEKYL